jgi:DNA-binding transcriptional LysR family regulator
MEQRMALPGQVDLNSLLVFDAVVEAGSFTAAAARLGIATAKVSIEISRLETRLGTALLTRTTRKVTLTDAGQALHLECQPLLHGLQQALDQLGGDKSTLAGSLRISTTVDYAVQSVAPALAQFAALHPGLQIDLRTGDRVVDLVGEGIDVAIRLGWLRDSSLRATQLGQFEQYIVAAPEYVQRTARVEQPQDLAGHEWVALTLLPTPLTWKFTAAGGDTQTVHVKSKFRVDSPGALRSVLRQGTGISALDQYSAREEIQSGRLVRLLADWSLPVAGVYAVYPPGRNVSARVRAFVAFFRDWLQRS